MNFCFLEADGNIYRYFRIFIMFCFGKVFDHFCLLVFFCLFHLLLEKQKDIRDECYDGGCYDRTAARRNITCLLDNGLSVSQTFTRNLNLTLGMFSLSQPSAREESKYEMELIKHVPDRVCILRDTGIILSNPHRTLGPRIIINIPTNQQDPGPEPLVFSRLKDPHAGI